MRFSRVGWMVAVFVVVGALLAPAAFARGGIELKPPVAPRSRRWTIRPPKARRNS